MPEDDLAARIARYRETAETLRGIAEQLRFDPRRGNQLRALADGFERFAMSLDAAKWQTLRRPKRPYEAVHIMAQIPVTERERAAHYREQADKLRQLAKTEPDERMSDQLLALAEGYQALADHLAPTRN